MGIFSDRIEKTLCSISLIKPLYFSSSILFISAMIFIIYNTIIFYFILLNVFYFKHIKNNQVPKWIRTKVLNSSKKIK